MIQDIAPRQYHNEFAVKEPGLRDFLLYFEGNQVLMRKGDGAPSMITFEDVQDPELRRQVIRQAEYLFCIDDISYYSARDTLGLMQLAGSRTADGKDELCICDLSIFRNMDPQFMGFAGITASQIYRFRKSRKFCGKCGHRMEYGTVELDFVSPVAKLTLYGATPIYK